MTREENIAAETIQLQLNSIWGIYMIWNQTIIMFQSRRSFSPPRLHDAYTVIQQDTKLQLKRWLGSLSFVSCLDLLVLSLWFGSPIHHKNDSQGSYSHIFLQYPGEYPYGHVVNLWNIYELTWYDNIYRYIYILVPLLCPSSKLFEAIIKGLAGNVAGLRLQMQDLITWAGPKCFPPTTLWTWEVKSWGP